MRSFITLFAAAVAAALTASAADATHVAVAFRAPVINHVSYGHAVQTYSYGYTPPVAVFAAPAPAFSAPVVATEPPAVPSHCPATFSLFAAPAYSSFAAPVYSSFAAPVYGGFRSFAAPAYSTFSRFSSFHAPVATFRAPVVAFRAPVATFRAPVVQTFRAPVVPAGISRFSAPVGSQFFQQERRGLFGSSRTTIIR